MIEVSYAYYLSDNDFDGSRRCRHFYDDPGDCSSCRYRVAVLEVSL